MRRTTLLLRQAADSCMLSVNNSLGLPGLAPRACTTALCPSDDSVGRLYSGVTRLQLARVQVFQKGPLFPKKTF